MKNTFKIILTEWLPPICTVLSLVLSIITVFQTNKINKQQMKLSQQQMGLNQQQHTLNKEEYKEKIEAQANKIAIWKTSAKDKSLQMENPYSIPVYFTASNNSTLPIYDVLVIDVTSQIELDLDSLEQGYSANKKIEWSGSQEHYSYMQTLPPQKIIGVVQGYGNGMGKTDELVYFFKDTSGKRWFRNNRGKLYQLKGDDQFYTLINRLGIMGSDLSPFMNFNSENIKVSTP